MIHFTTIEHLLSKTAEIMQCESNRSGYNATAVPMKAEFRIILHICCVK